MRSILVVLFLSFVALSGTARADRKFHKVAGTKVKVRVASYDGSVNGALDVELRNSTSEPREFTARGLYFVPDGDPDEAPQRLGAVGPFVVLADDDAPVDRVTVAAGETVKVRLEVFCIDSHRDAPDSKTAFTVGKRRMPKKLAAKIAESTREAADEEGGYDAPMAKSKVQDAVWKSRDAKWVELDGEGDQEADK